VLFARERPGTAVLIHPGDYGEHFGVDGLYGTADNPIWIGGVPGEARPVLKGIHIARGAYVIFRDMEFRDAKDAGGTGTAVHVHDGGDTDFPTKTHHFVFRNLYLRDNQFQHFKFAGIDDVRIYGCRTERDQRGGSGGINFVGCHHLTVTDSIFRDMKGFSLQFKGGSYDADVYGNRFEGCGGPGINIGQATGEQFFRPYLTKDRTMYEARDIRIYGNAFTGGTAAFAMTGCTDCSFTGNTVENPSLYLFRVLNMDMDDELKLANRGMAHGNTISGNTFVFGELMEAFNVGEGTQIETFKIENNVFNGVLHESYKKPQL